MIGARGIQVFAHGLPEGRINRAHSAFHFVKNHPFVGKIRAAVIGCSKLQSMTFLSEI